MVSSKMVKSAGLIEHIVLCVLNYLKSSDIYCMYLCISWINHKVTCQKPLNKKLCISFPND
jgi:hypothetical protein